jgi:hypothetical protein
MLVGWTTCISLPGFAQDRHHSKERMQKIQNAKIAFITEKLNLTSDQAQRFWPVYNQYDAERLALKEKSHTLRTSNFDAMSEAELRTALNNRFSWRQEELDLDKFYMDKFLKVISVRQLATLYRSEREFMRVLLKKLDTEPTATNR